MKIIILTFILSRLFFLAEFPHFYDGPEYLKLAQLNFAHSLSVSHASIHPISYLIWQFICKIQPCTSAWPISFTSALAGIASIYLFIKISRYYGLDPKMGLASLVFMPAIWLLQTNVATESSSHLLALIAWYLALHQNQSNRYHLLSLFFASHSIFNYSIMALWIPAYLLVMYLNKHSVKKIIVSFFTIVLLMLFWYLTLSWLINVPFLKLIGGIKTEGMTITTLFSLGGIIHAIYQALFAFQYNFGLAGLITVLLIFARILQHKQIKSAIALLCISLTYIVLLSWWHGGLYGRLGSFVAYPLALGISQIPRKFSLPVILLFIPFWLKIVIAYQLPPKVITTMDQIEKSGYQNDSILIVSETERPQMEIKFPNLLSINEVSINQILRVISTTDSPIYITEQALNFPYRQYDGQLPHPLQGGASDEGLLKQTLLSRGKYILIK